MRSNDCVFGYCNDVLFHKHVQEKLAKDGVFEALKDFTDIQVIGFEKSKIN